MWACALLSLGVEAPADRGDCFVDRTISRIGQMWENACLHWRAKDVSYRAGAAMRMSTLAWAKALYGHR